MSPQSTKMKNDDALFRDQPFGNWLFASVFLALGGLVLGVGLAEWEDWRLETLSIVVGTFNIIGGLVLLWRRPASVVRISRQRDRVLIHRYGLFGYRELEFPLSRLQRIDVETRPSPQGGLLYRPRMLFIDHEPQPLSMLWTANRGRCMTLVQKLQALVG